MAVSARRDGSNLLRAGADARTQFDRLLGELRPRLHRFCARMTGSVIDGEDIVQEAMLKALELLSGAEAIDNVEAWVFRIAHNAALDFLAAEPASSPVSPARVWT